MEFLFLVLIIAVTIWYIRNNKKKSSSFDNLYISIPNNKTSEEDCNITLSYPPIPENIKEEIYKARILNAINKRRLDIPFPKQYTERYGYNWKKTINILLENNLAVLSTDYNSLKVAELKELLRENNLKISGNKSELVQRVADAQLNTDFKKTYALTSKGKEYINKYNLFIYNEKNYLYDYTDEELYFLEQSLKEKNEYISPYDTLIKAITLHLAIHYKEKNWSNFGGTYSILYSLQKDLKDYNNALISWIKYQCCILSGLRYDNYLTPVNEIIFYPYMRSELNNILEKISPTEDELKSIIKQTADEIYQQLPFSYFDTETTIDIIINLTKSLNIDVTEYPIQIIPSEFTILQYSTFINNQ